MAQEKLDQEKGGRILRLEKSFLGSKQKCAQWKAQIVQLGKKVAQIRAKVFSAEKK